MNFIENTRRSPSYKSPSPSYVYRLEKCEKVVTNCKNCSYSFRVAYSDSQDFCSKDCQTCYTLFYKLPYNESPTSMNRNNAMEVKKSIYEFQQKLDQEDGVEFSSAKILINTDHVNQKKDPLMNNVNAFVAPKPVRPQMPAYF